MTNQKETQLREKAREMFDKKFPSWYDEQGLYLGKPTVNGKRWKFVDGNRDLPEEMRNFIDEIITLALEEKVRVVKQLSHNETGLMPEMGIFDDGYELAKQDIIKILKQ